MRNQWRFLLRYNQIHNFISPSNISRHFYSHKLTPNPTFSPQITPFTPHFHPTFLPHFSTISENSTDLFPLINIFTKPINGFEIDKELSAINAVFTHDIVTNVLKNLNNDPKTAIKFFDYVLEKQIGSLSCKGYNFMLGVLGSNGLFKEFWGLYDLMVKRGFGVRKGTYEKVFEKFEKEGSQFDVEKLKNLYSKDVRKIETECVRVSNIVERKVWDESVEEKLKGLGVDYSSELVKMVLGKLKDEPIKGLKFFRWVEGSGSFRHDQGSYNAMVVALGRGGCLDEFWNLVEGMRNVGVELEKETYGEVCESFFKEKMVEDAVRLYEYAMDGANKPSREDFIVLVKKVFLAKEVGMDLFSRVVNKYLESGLYKHDQGTYNAMAIALGRLDCFERFWNLVDDMRNLGFELEIKTFSKVSERFIRNNMVDDVVRLHEYVMNGANKPSREDCVFLLQKVVVANEVDMELFSRVVMKFLEIGLFELDQGTYNAIAATLGRRECFDKFWNLVDDMRNRGFELELVTYDKVSKSFVKNNMLEDAVRLYEYAMNGENKPSRGDCIYLLKKVVVAKEIDMELFSRVVKIFSEYGNALDDSMLNFVHKFLKSVGRMDMHIKVLDAMVECGYKPDETMLCKVAFHVSYTSMKGEAREFIDKAREYFEIMVKREGSSSSTTCALNLLVNAYCNTERAAEACRILVNNEDIKPAYVTYKALISLLLTQNSFEEAISLIGLMRKHEFPLFLDPFIAYIVKRETTDEAMVFFKALTVKNSPPINVVHRVLEAYLEAGEHKKAHDLLARCPQYIRNNAGILNLLYSMKPETNPVAVAAA